MKSAFHNLIPFLPLFSNCQFRRLDSVQFLCSQAHILEGWCLGTRLDSTLCCFGTSCYIALGRTPRKQRLQLSRIVLGLFTNPLPSNSRPIVARVGFRGNVLTESLPSNGFIRHIIIFRTLYNLLVLYVFLEIHNSRYDKGHIYACLFYH
jgi:hypothetical protein